MLCCMVRSSSPKALALGARLRAARTATGKSQREVGKALKIDSGTLSRYETGERPPGPEEVAAILAVLGVSGVERDEIIDLARNPSGTTWLAVSLPEQRAQLSALLEFEQMATEITAVAPLLPPGLLQTGPFARAMMREGDVPDDEVEMRVAVRVGRRDILMRSENPAHLTAFIGASVLRGRIGGAHVMAGQLDHLLKMGRLPNVDIHIIPDECGWHPGLEGPFVLLSNKTMSLVNLENRRSGLFLQEEGDLTAYQGAVEKVLSVAMSPDQSSELIAREAERIKRVE